METEIVRLSARFAPPIEEVAGLLKKKLSGMDNPGELMSELQKELGENKLVLLTFLRPHPMVRGHTVLNILLTQQGSVTTAELSCISTSSYAFGNTGRHGYRREAEEVLRSLGFAGENDAELAEKEEDGLLSAVKTWWRKDEV